MPDATRQQRGPRPTDDHRNLLDRVSIQAHVFSDDTGNESAPSDRIVEECSDPRLDFGTNAGIGSRRERVQIGGPDVGACDFVAVAVNEPMKGREASLNGKRRVRLGKVAGGTCQRLGISGRAVGERNRLIEEPGIFCRGAPFAFVAGCQPNKV